MNKIFTCHRCGVVARAERQLCRPVPVPSPARACAEPVKPPEPCMSGVTVPRYVCRNCGQPALEGELICNPYMPD